MGAAIIESRALYEAMLYGHWIVFVLGPVILFKCGHPIAGGVVMLLATMMPLAGQAWFTDSDAYGLAFLLFLEAPIALLVLLVGLAIGLPRIYRRLMWRSECE